MKGKHSIKKRFHKPYHFLAKAGKNSADLIEELFNNFQVSDFRHELSLWQQLALSNDQSAYDEAGAREDLIDFVNALQKLIEAIYIIREKNSSETRNSRQEKKLKQAKKLLQHYNRLVLLTDREKRKPYDVIQDFCKSFKVQYAKIEIADLMEAVVTYDGTKRFDRGNIVLFYQHLRCIIKMAYQMEEKLNKKQ